MRKEIRTVKYDAELKLEAYRFEGVMQEFPNHFHDYYVIGFIENGRRFLSCKSREYTIAPGDLLLFNPGDSHACAQCEGGALDYRCVNIPRETMRRAVFEISGKENLPYFTEQVVFHSDLVALLRELHLAVMEEEKEFKKEELFFFLLEQLIEEYAEPFDRAHTSNQNEEVSAVCEFMRQNYMQNITLDDLSRIAGLSKYYLLRTFTKQQGISPYSYLITIRVGKAKKLLEQGVSPIEAALQAGFSDQSHFSNFFKKLIGLTPKQYMRIFDVTANDKKD
ncbi:MAG TPA: AraC family transcriptional regulator [Eubacteriales bacterium]|nr:AraC family transcriptional regulator [Eubacteriales bacterium]